MKVYPFCLPGAALLSAAVFSMSCATAPTEPTAQAPTASASTAADAGRPVATAPQSPIPVSSPQDAVSSDDALRASQRDQDLMLYESWPEETTLNNDHIADVVPVWLDAIRGAQKSIDFSEYYATPGPALTPVVDAIREAAQRGVKIRFIVDAKMNRDENAELPRLLDALPGVEVRVIPYADIAGGVQHAKYFIVDGKTAYFGSQNFDWRSLSQISEMGARLRPHDLVAPLAAIFELDWKLAESPLATVEQGTCHPAVTLDYKGEPTTVQTVASPKGVLPCETLWDLPKILAMIGEAKHSVSVQLLNYATLNYDKTTFTELDDALTAAAGRGVHVRLLVSDWSTKPKNMSDLTRLAQIPNIETRMIEIPEHSDGFVPYSRTIHSKFLLVDDDKTWLGTSNWAGDYFYHSRNVGIIATGRALNQDLSLSFERYWNSPYAIPVDPATSYPVKDQSKPPVR